MNLTTCPTPSATQITAEPLLSRRYFRCLRTPCGPYKLKSTLEMQNRWSHIGAQKKSNGLASSKSVTSGIRHISI